MRGRYLSLIAALTALLASTCFGSSGSAAQGAAAEPARAEINFDIPAQRLESALVLFGRHANVQLLYDANLTEGLRSQPVRGRYTVGQAIRIMLGNTGLDVRRAGVNAITIMRAGRGERGVMVLDAMRVTAPPRVGANPQFALYGMQVERRISDHLGRQRGIARGSYAVGLKIWLNPEGRITEAAIAHPSGDASRDHAIVEAVRNLEITNQPPKDMPQPIRLLFNARPAM